MIDNRLIDYSEGYRDYGDKLRDEGMELRLGDVLLILEGFLMRYSGALTGDGGERFSAMPMGTDRSAKRDRGDINRGTDRSAKRDRGDINQRTDRSAKRDRGTGIQLEDKHKSSGFDKDGALILHLLQALKLGRACNMQP